MIKNRNSSRFRKNKKLAQVVLLSILAIALALVSLWSFMRQDSVGPLPIDISSASEEDEGKVNYDRPSEKEVSENDRQKEELIKQQASSDEPADSNSIKKVTVAITNWGTEGQRFEVGAYANTVDPSGNCTLKLSKDGVTISGKSVAIRNPSTMSCGNLFVDANRMSAGNWNATIAYNSSTSTGSLNKIIKVE